jgi:predicted nucleotidyltransferase
VALGALERRAEGRLVCYRPVAPSSVWQAVRLLLADTSDPATIVRDALHDVPGIDAAFVFGSFAKGTAVRESDVDVFIVESPDVDRRLLHRQLAEAGVVMNREVNAIRYTPQALAERLGDPNHAAARFLRDTLAGPKRWVAGAVAAIQPIATAAGLRLTDQLAMIP